MRHSAPESAAPVSLSLYLQNPHKMQSSEGRCWSHHGLHGLLLEAPEGSWLVFQHSHTCTADLTWAASDVSVHHGETLGSGKEGWEAEVDDGASHQVLGKHHWHYGG